MRGTEMKLVRTSVMSEKEKNGRDVLKEKGGALSLEGPGIAPKGPFVLHTQFNKALASTITFLAYIREVLGSFLDLEDNYTDLRFWRFSSDTLGESHDGTQIRSRPPPSALFPI